MQALDQIEEDALLRLVRRLLGPAWLLDRTGRPRVSFPWPHWPEIVSAALDGTLLYGSLHPQVVRRLRALPDRVWAEPPRGAAGAARRAPGRPGPAGRRCRMAQSVPGTRLRNRPLRTRGPGRACSLMHSSKECSSSRCTTIPASAGEQSFCRGSATWSTPIGRPPSSSCSTSRPPEPPWWA
ncbi:hypothetical protein [Streptomyces sp. NPDC007206]|uniref:hypothetical protein n=1 Tax=Streptomyces sp. NPDC007206 TaxID=3154317 RepID=UPI0033F6F67D